MRIEQLFLDAEQINRENKQMVSPFKEIILDNDIIPEEIETSDSGENELNCWEVSKLLQNKRFSNMDIYK